MHASAPTAGPGKPAEALADRLIKDFSNKAFAHSYMQDHCNVVIAAQIKALRKQRELSLEALAQLAKVKKELITALENADTTAWTVRTLHKLAEAFDVHLKVAFAPFSEGLMDVASLRQERLEVPPRTEDLAQLTEKRLHRCDRPRKAQTLGEFRAATADLPDDTPLSVDTGDGYPAPEFYVGDDGLLFEAFPQGD